jgi:predicted methyltransferase
MLAHEFLQRYDDKSIDGILYDPPYSVRQVKEVYNGIGLQVTQQDTQTWFYTKIKNEIQRVMKPGGKIISFGWNSGGMGKKRGFEISRILLVPHGGVRNDTIVTVETKK